MFARVRIHGMVVLACLIAASSVAARNRAGGAQSFSVASSLDGKTVLPHRIHWLAWPSGSSSRILEVDFLIDGRKSWIEKKAPYIYGDIGNWLVTSALSPGRHRFTVRAKAKDGTTAQRTTIARVLPAAPPPRELAGSWERLVTKEQAGPVTPAGTWAITIDSTGWIIRDPDGARGCRCGNWIDVAYSPGNLVELRGGIWTQPNDARVKLGGNGWCNDTHAPANYDLYGTNAPVEYGWTVSSDTLTVTLNGPTAAAQQTQSRTGSWLASGRASDKHQRPERNEWTCAHPGPLVPLRKRTLLRTPSDGVRLSPARCPYAWPKSWPRMPWRRMVDRCASSSTSWGSLVRAQYRPSREAHG